MAVRRRIPIIKSIKAPHFFPKKKIKKFKKKKKNTWQAEGI